MDSKYLYQMVQSDYNHYTRRIAQYLNELARINADAKELNFEFDVIRMLFPVDAEYYDRNRIKNNVEDTKELIDRSAIMSGKFQKFQSVVDKKYSSLLKMDGQYLTSDDTLELIRLEHDYSLDGDFAKMQEEIEYESSESKSLASELEYWKSIGMGLTV